MSNQPDDLTTIVGIGKTYEERLNNAGITTFKQLIKATAAEIRKATEASQSIIRYWKIEAENRL